MSGLNSDSLHIFGPQAPFFYLIRECFEWHGAWGISQEQMAGIKCYESKGILDGCIFTGRLLAFEALKRPLRWYPKQATRRKRSVRFKLWEIISFGKMCKI